MCGKICKDVFTLQRHIAIVHEERKYKCDECEATFKQQKNVKRHKDSVHLKKTSFTCMQCETQFPRNSYLKRHLKLLHENTPKQIGRPLTGKKDLSAKNKFMCCRTHVLTS